jgi:hypothetical protein
VPAFVLTHVLADVMCFLVIAILWGKTYRDDRTVLTNGSSSRKNMGVKNARCVVAAPWSTVAARRL